jgi:purine-cytosine permease-like protein
MAMHIGMSDLSVFRYAKKSWYGIASASGMYVGHFMAWISASILYAYQLHLDPTDTDVLPGPLAYRAAGLAGILCVIIAGWTTANPTIYRAGLAFQAIIPKVSRFKVTLATGMIATIAGMFPAFAMKLLDFVAIYGLLLMPMGAVIFVDFWLIKKFGLKSNYAHVSKTYFNWAAGLAWIVTVVICFALVKSDYTLESGFKPFQIYFVSLPGWFIAAILYIGLSAFYQHKIHSLPLAKSLAQGIGWLSLIILVLTGILFLAGNITLSGAKVVMMVVTILWFIAASMWMWSSNSESSE